MVRNRPPFAQPCRHLPACIRPTSHIRRADAFAICLGEKITLANQGGGYSQFSSSVNGNPPIGRNWTGAIRTAG